MVLLLTPDLDSYLLALGHPPIMGRKEQEKKARRAAAGLEVASPAKAGGVKRPAGPPAASRTASTSTTEGLKEPNEHREPPVSPARPGEYPASSAGSGNVEAAGSGNPASSVSSGKVEAEGVHGQYTCAECGKKCYRSVFLIEQTDLEGNLSPEKDWEGKLHGRCYECCRGRGPNHEPDMYADIKGDTSEEALQKVFKRECTRRHMTRSDAKKKRTPAAEDQKIPGAPGRHHEKAPGPLQK